MSSAGNDPPHPGEEMLDPDRSIAHFLQSLCWCVDTGFGLLVTISAGGGGAEPSLKSDQKIFLMIFYLSDTPEIVRSLDILLTDHSVQCRLTFWAFRKTFVSRPRPLSTE